jgi:hypothetical protein
MAGCAVAGCRSQNALPSKHANEIYDSARPGHRKHMMLCRRHEVVLDLGGSWTFVPETGEIILNDDPSMKAFHVHLPLFVLEDVGSVGRSSERLPGTDVPVKRLTLTGFWPGHDLPEGFEVVITDETATALREQLPRLGRHLW